MKLADIFYSFYNFFQKPLIVKNTKIVKIVNDFTIATPSSDFSVWSLYYVAFFYVFFCVCVCVCFLPVWCVCVGVYVQGK